MPAAPKVAKKVVGKFTENALREFDTLKLETVSSNIKICADALRIHMFFRKPAELLSDAKVIHKGLGFDIAKLSKLEGEAFTTALVEEKQVALNKIDGTQFTKLTKRGLREELNGVVEALEETVGKGEAHYIEHAISGRGI